MTKVDIIIITDGDDISLHFVTPNFYDEMRWSQEEVKLSDSVCTKDKWKAAALHRERIWLIFGEALENKDPRIIQSIYSQAFTNGEDVNKEYCIGRIMNLED